MRVLILIATALMLAGCGPKVVFRDRAVEVKVPVAAPCMGERPARPVPLVDKTPDWDSYDVRQKAAHVGKQGLERLAYGENLDAASGACP